MESKRILIAKVAKKAAETSLRRNANRTTCLAFYQPKAPVELQRFKNSSASTSAGTSDGISLSTTVIFYFTNSGGQTETSSRHGASSAVAGTTNSKGLRATSQHSVNGDSRWGNWSANLSANA